MNIENMKDGKYVLIYLKDQDDEFEIKVKDGKEVKDGKDKKHTIYRNNHGKVSLVEDDEISLLCDLHESEDWITEEELQTDQIEPKSFKRN